MRRLPFGRVLVRGSSMAPTLRDGDQLLVRWNAAVRPGDVVVVRLPERPLSVKRLLRMENGACDVRGDDPPASTDSRQLGLIPRYDVYARVLARYWPWPPAVVRRRTSV